MRDGDVIEMEFETCEFKRVGEKNTPLCELQGKATEDGEPLTVAIWLSEKAAGIARQQFKRIGFEIDKHDLSRLGEFLKQKKPRTMVTIESYERQGAVLYRGVIEVGNRTLPKEDLATFTKFMREAKKDNEAAVKDEPKGGNEKFSAEDIDRARQAEKRKPSDGIDVSDIPFVWMLPLVVATLAVMA